MDQRVGDLTRLQEKVDRSRQMEYQVTAQSHFRAMALLTHDNSNNDKIAAAKKTFAEHLDAVQRMSAPAQSGFFDRVRETDNRFAAASAKVLALYLAGNNAAAQDPHLKEELAISQGLESVRKVNAALAGIVAGDFTTHVAVANRDDLGELSANVPDAVGWSSVRQRRGRNAREAQRGSRMRVVSSDRRQFAKRRRVALPPWNSWEVA